MSQSVETYSGTQLPSCDWYWGTAERLALADIVRLEPQPRPPSAEDEGYTHTLLFAFRRPSDEGSTQILLARKLRGFGAGTHNGVGGKVDPQETARECILRETREEVGVKLGPQEVQFVGKVGIKVPGKGGESVRIAVFTTDSEMVREEVMASDEVEARWYDVGSITGGEGEGLLDSIPGQMRPEHKVYLGLLVGYQATKGILFNVNVDFHQQPSKAQLPAGERPENHRTVRHWSLNVFHSHPSTDTIQCAP
ncbi:NUDIX hydrolase domain protein [Kalmanozyma brasiliensis GHG001]|uniref:NUDIX hydrolase domain protein n=1 Tax=Kalmanozyma brasiliensis (strain GHG001) TaxID=1365824 RepID=UPI002867C75E|nr:NUDIX hydrolase domain protein [Kalmanozyma brasiliensis GHG001]KAF6767561.1 NUDIX hydrolase domain protein [Kalmanozyma brasiliensis GHG001]